MQYLLLSKNRLTGSFVIQNLPPRMKVIYAQENHFSAIAVVGTADTHTVFKLKGSGVTSVVDENGKELDTKRFLA